jgi:hypothetical protein
MGDYFKPLLSAWVEILVGILILFSVDDIRWFWLYLLLVIVHMVGHSANYLRKLIRVYQVFNEMKLIVIMRKLKITEDEISIVTDEEKRKMGDEKWQEIEKELQDLIGK